MSPPPWLHLMRGETKHQFVRVASFSLFLSPHPHPSPNFVAYFFCALKNCLWRGLDESCQGRVRGSARGERRAEEASEGLPLYLPAQTSIVSDSPSLFLSFPPSHVVRLLIDTDSCMWNKKLLSFM